MIAATSPSSTSTNTYMGAPVAISSYNVEESSGTDVVRAVCVCWKTPFNRTQKSNHRVCPNLFLLRCSVDMPSELKAMVWTHLTHDTL